MEKRVTYKNLPIAAHVSLETEERLQDLECLRQKIQKHGLVPTIVEVFQNPGLNAREVHVRLEAQEEESAFDYELNMSEQPQDYEDREMKEESNEEDSSEESHEEEAHNNLMSEIFARLNQVSAGNSIAQDDFQQMRQTAGQWIKSTRRSMKRLEDYEDYESQDEEERKTWNTCQKLRTQYTRDADRICFTTRPVLSCASSCRATATTQATSVHARALLL